MIAPHLGFIYLSRMDTSLDIRIEATGLHELSMIRQLNAAIFNDMHIINRFDRPNLMILIAYDEAAPVGFKIGYALDQHTFYSAKGGVLQTHRRQGIARRLLYEMMERSRQQGYTKFVFDTFPNRHAGMTILGLTEGFTVTAADFNTVYQDFRIRFQKKL